jgi:hypothetical protein
MNTTVTHPSLSITLCKLTELTDNASMGRKARFELYLELQQYLNSVQTSANGLIDADVRGRLGAFKAY